MTKGGLEKLKEIMMEIENIRDKAYSLMIDTHRLYTMEEDVEDRDAHMMLKSAVNEICGVVFGADRAISKMQGAYKSEKALNNSVEKAGEEEQ